MNPYESTLEFLAHFPGRHCFVSCDDKKRTNVPKHFHTGYDLSLDQIFAELELWNGEDWGAFFCVNEIDRRHGEGHRTTEMLVGLRAIFADDDKSGELRSVWPAPPSLVVNSSPGKFHYYWLIDQEGFEFTPEVYETWTRIQTGIARDFGTDPQSRDSVRILRLPGFEHRKGDPVRTTWNGTGEAYRWERLVEIFPQAESYRKDDQDGSASDDPLDDLDEEELARLILSGKNYHGAIMKLSLKWANSRVAEDEQLERFTILLDQVENKDSRWKARSNPQYLRANITDALKYVKDNPKKGLVSDIEIGDEVQPEQRSEIPAYPNGWMEKLPDPWPMVWENFSRMPRELDEALLVPTILASVAHILDGRYQTVAGRRPNMIFLNLAPSAAYKDVNSTEVLNDLGEAFTIRGAIMNRFMSLASTDKSITSDTAFLKSVEDGDGDLLWVNTEATRIFQQISSKQRNTPAAVMALSDKLIEVVDGRGLSGKQKANERVKSIPNPNVQCLFYAQPDTVIGHIDPIMVASGLLGRVVMSHSRPRRISREEYSPFSIAKAKRKDVDDEFFDFFNSPAFHKDPEVRPFRCVMHEDRCVPKLNDWARDTFYAERFGNDDMVASVVERIAITAEQLYAVVFGLCNTWDTKLGCTQRRDVKVDPIITFLDYLHCSKMYTIGEFVEEKGDDFTIIVEEIMTRIISGELKIKHKAAERIRKEQKLVKVSSLRNHLMKSRKAKQACGDHSLDDRLSKTLISLNKNGIIIRKEIKPASGGVVAEYVGYKRDR